MGRKYIVIVPDGAADRPLEALGGKTVFEAARKPNIDWIASNGRQGLCRTVPPSLQPGSDVAMMAVLGYNPMQYYSGRAPIEAVAQGIDVSDTDWIFRCNLVTIAGEKMADHSAGHISSEEGKTFVEELTRAFGTSKLRFYPGVGYRHLMIVGDLDFNGLETFPPHDNIGAAIAAIMPKGKNSEFLSNLIVNSRQLFLNHPLNLARTNLGKGAASSIWLWGQGKRRTMQPFEKVYGVKGAAITAVDRVRGLARLVGFDLLNVEGATGYFDTNYRGKGKAAIEALKKYDIVLVHVEAPDEAGHAGDAAVKKKAVEDIDEHIVGPVLAELKKYREWRILVMPDHPTPVSTRGHAGEAVPFAMAGSGIPLGTPLPLSESNAAKTGDTVENGCELMSSFIRG